MQGATAVAQWSLPALLSSSAIPGSNPEHVIRAIFNL